MHAKVPRRVELISKVNGWTLIIVAFKSESSADPGCVLYMGLWSSTSEALTKRT